MMITHLTCVICFKLKKIQMKQAETFIQNFVK